MDESPASSEDNEPVHSKWEDILGNGKLQKLVLEAGTGSRPNMGNLVHVTYKVYPFEESENDFNLFQSKEPPFHRKDSFYLGEGDANLHALELGVALMNVGEKAVIKCANPMLSFEGEPPEYRPGNIPPSSNLFIFVELLSDGGPPLPWPQRPRAERLECASNKVDRGNAYCRAKIFASAINAYSAAIRILGYKPASEDGNDMGEEEEYSDDAEKEIRAKALSGLSAAHFNTSSFDNALKCCDDALKIKPDLVKVIFRRGRSLFQLGRFLEAKEAMSTARSMVLENAHGLTPDFMTFLDSELNRVRLRLQQDTKREADLYRRMIDVKPLPPSAFKKSAANWLTYKVGVVVAILVVSLGMFISIIFNYH